MTKNKINKQIALAAHVCDKLFLYKYSMQKQKFIAL